MDFGSLFILLLLGTIVSLWCGLWYIIFKNAGYSGWLGVLMLVPYLNVIVFLYFALSEWPINKENKLLWNKLKSLKSRKSKLSRKKK